MSGSLVIPQLTGCDVSRETVERLTVVGPQSKGTEVLDVLWENGFRVMRSGPYTDRAMHPKVDVSRFLFIAERVTDGNG